MFIPLEPENYRVRRERYEILVQLVDEWELRAADANRVRDQITSVVGNLERLALFADEFFDIN